MRTLRNTKRIRHTLAAGASVLSAVALSACTDGKADNTYGSFNEVVIAMPEWEGAQANVAVAEHVLEERLDVTVEKRRIDQSRAWDGMDEGSIHALLEDWGLDHDKEQLYLRDRGSVVSAGNLGVVGHVGWYVPQWFADEHPEVLDWKNLNDFAEVFQTPESGEQGQLLQGEHTYTSWDESLIDQLGLDYETVPAGSQRALLETIRKAERDRVPLLTYWWQPQWLNTEVEMAEVRLPEYTEGCQDDPEAVACAYPEIRLPKYLNAEFDEHGGDAAAFLREFSWTTEDQNEVAYLVEGQGMSLEAAAEQWVKDNADVVADWLPEGY